MRSTATAGEKIRLLCCSIVAGWFPAYLTDDAPGGLGLHQSLLYDEHLIVLPDQARGDVMSVTPRLCEADPHEAYVLPNRQSGRDKDPKLSKNSNNQRSEIHQ